MPDLHPIDHARTATRSQQRQADGASWPVPAVALAALADMGMSDEAIGRYLRVDPAVVREARSEPSA